MICPICSHDNPQDANFCGNCGRLLINHCPRCETKIETKSNFCQHCGLALSPHGQWVSWQPAVDGRADGIGEVQLPYFGRKEKAPLKPETSEKVDNRKQELDRFLPQQLADKLEQARRSGTFVGERRVVTMLFCDVQGSTAAAEKLDPEEWTDIINGAFEYMIKPVYQYEGTVARLMGDAILAFFGAPIAHEDDPQRAVLTGLDIVSGFSAYQNKISEQHGFHIAVRVGINTGLVVAGAVGSDLRMEYSAMGDAINLAARMEQTAEPGTVQIAEATYQQVKPLFEFETLEPVQVKGKEEPVQAYRVLRRKQESQSLRGIEGMHTPLIGRNRELASLKEILDRTRQGLGHIACLTGEAGLGKSRLIEEGHQYWEELGSPGTWLNVSSFSYESNHAYGLVQRLVRRLLNIAVSDSPDAVRQKLEMLTTHFSEDRQARVLRLFESLYSLRSLEDQPSITGETFRQELFAVMEIIARQQYQDQPAVYVFDDLHWSDPASLELLTHLLQVTESIPLVMIFSYRPNQDAPASRLQEKASKEFGHRFTEFNLHPLPDEDMNAILDALLANADLPQSMRQNILDRAGGNPFFVEEVVRSLVLSGSVVREERSSNGQQQVWRVVEGVGLSSIPENLHSLLAARIDRLDQEIKATLQLASVIGRSFYERVLQEMAQLSNGAATHTPQHLRQLLQLEMIQEAARIPQVEYIFRNPLTQEVAYNSILLKRRREYHEWVGRVMESLYPDQINEIAPRLAFHFQEAGQLEKAFDYYVQAGNQANQLYAIQEALAQYDQAAILLDDIQPHPRQLLQLFINRGRALEHNGQYTDADENYKRLAQLADNYQDDEIALQALIARGTLYAMQTPLHDAQIAMEITEEGLALAQELGNKAGEAKIQWNLMILARYRGGENDIKIAIEYGEKSLQLAREMNLHSQVALTLNDLASMFLYSKEVEKANLAAQEARKLFRELGNLPMLADSYSQSSFYFAHAGQYAKAEEFALENKKISEEIGNLWNIGTSGEILGFLEMERGHLQAAYSIIMAAIERPGMKQVSLILANLKLRLVEVLMEAGDVSRASSYAYENLLVTESNHYLSYPYKSLIARMELRTNPDQASSSDLTPDQMPHSNQLAYYHSFERHYQIELAIALDESVLAIEKAQDALALCDKFDLKSLMPVFGLLLAKAYRQNGDSSAANQALMTAETTARQIGSRRALWPILVQKVESNEEPADEARLVDDAWQVIEYIVEHAGEGNLRQSFLNRPEVKKIQSRLK